MNVNIELKIKMQDGKEYGIQILEVFQSATKQNKGPCLSYNFSSVNEVRRKSN